MSFRETVSNDAFQWFVVEPIRMYCDSNISVLVSANKTAVVLLIATAVASRLQPHTAMGAVGCGVATSASVLMLDSSNRLRHSEHKQSVSANIDVRAS
ncbi:hypothetical protein [Microbacterium sp. 22296]|uniref:hypothetical protein n=1 Tax=Microbacterium sp. 22296 TaxID=3453903 RepID=UPI003F84FABF